MANSKKIEVNLYVSKIERIDDMGNITYWVTVNLDEKTTGKLIRTYEYDYSEHDFKTFSDIAQKAMHSADELLNVRDSIK